MVSRDGNPNCVAKFRNMYMGEKIQQQLYKTTRRIHIAARLFERTV